jgi:hypothetical protein
MMLDTGAKNTAARRFYRVRAGYRDIGVVLVKDMR